MVNGGKQDQVVENNSTAIQAGGDVHYHGLSFNEVRELCTLFLRENLPRLRAEAQQVAEQRVQEFSGMLVEKVIDNASSVLINKFSDPDVQASVNDAVIASAKKGQGAHPGVLSTLITQRLASDSTEYDDIVLAEAILIVPKLTKKHLTAISLVYLVTSALDGEFESLASLDDFGKEVTPYLNNASPLLEKERQHIVHTGALTIPMQNLADAWDYLPTVVGVSPRKFAKRNSQQYVDFVKRVRSEASTFARLLENYQEFRFNRYGISGVGEAIAVAHTSFVVPPRGEVIRWRQP